MVNSKVPFEYDQSINEIFVYKNKSFIYTNKDFIFINKAFIKSLQLMEEKLPISQMEV